jgi:hypothetical protein
MIIISICPSFASNSGSADENRNVASDLHTIAYENFVRGYVCTWTVGSGFTIHFLIRFFLNNKDTFQCALGGRRKKSTSKTLDKQDTN